VAHADYDTQTEPPERLIVDGQYQPGWYRRYPSHVDVSRSVGASRRHHRWFFVQFQVGKWFIGFNLADLHFGCNTGVLILDTETGTFRVESCTDLLWRKRLEISSDCARFEDPVGGHIALDGRGVEFDVRARGLRIRGSASPLFDEHFVQCTRFHEGHGTLQQWGNLRLNDGSLVIDGETIALEPGSLGAFDRSFGHRRPVENWNWLVAVGHARQGDQRQPFALHLARDGRQARPRLDLHRFPLWIDGELHRMPELDLVVPSGRTLQPWSIRCSEGPVKVDLTFQPRWHRRDHHRVPLVFQVDHSQFFGPLSGTITTSSGQWTVSDVVATSEDTRMAM